MIRQLRSTNGSLARPGAPAHYRYLECPWHAHLKSPGRLSRPRGGRRRRPAGTKGPNRLGGSRDAATARRREPGVMDRSCLIVDDDATYARGLRILLERNGCNVVAITSSATDAVAEAE